MQRFWSTAARGALAGLIAGIPQVILAQLEAVFLDMPRKEADIGPRFIRRLAQRTLGATPSPAMQWLLATLFHFGYAVQWGVLYSLIQQIRPVPPLVGAPFLSAVIYSVAFPRWGAATQTGTERPPEQRSSRETLLHWTSTLSFSLTTAFVERWLRDRSCSRHVDDAVAEWTGSNREPSK